MGSAIGKKLPPRLKRVLLRVYNSLLEFRVLIERKYTEVYVRTCPIKQNKVVFSRFSGLPYGDNPKYIAGEMISRNLGWDLVWLAKDPELPLPAGIRSVRIGTQKALREMASAKFIVDNIRNTKRPPKRKQVYLQTWHGGLAFKAVEGDVPGLNPDYVAAAKQDGKNCDGIISSCGIQTEEFRRCFWLHEMTEILEFGLPRNDKLFNNQVIDEAAEAVRVALGIAPNKRMVLYMPTFRDDRSMDGYELDYQGVLAAFEERFGTEFVMVVRMHPNVQDHAGAIPYDERIINGTVYPDAQELYMAADFLITDYSSAAFDFALLKRPVFLCALDYDKFRKERGLVSVFEECPFPHAYTNHELKDCVAGFSQEAYDARCDAYMKVWRPFDRGDAARRIVDWMIAKNK